MKKVEDRDLKTRRYVCEHCGHETEDVKVTRENLEEPTPRCCPKCGKASEAPTLHLGDVVEEIATGRRGKIDNMSIDEQQTVTYWRVFSMTEKIPCSESSRTHPNFGWYRVRTPQPNRVSHPLARSFETRRAAVCAFAPYFPQYGSTGCLPIPRKLLRVCATPA